MGAANAWRIGDQTHMPATGWWGIDSDTAGRAAAGKFKLTTARGHGC